MTNGIEPRHWYLIKHGYQFVQEAPELLGHVLWRGSLQHQQHLPVQGLIQRGDHTHRGGKMVDSMCGLREK